MSSDSYPLDSPPVSLTPATRGRERQELEKSAVREAITSVCETCVGERGAKLQTLIDRIEGECGPKAAFDSIIKLLEFSQPKLQRVTVADPDGNATKQPIINVTFHSPTTVKIVEDYDAD